MAKLVVFIHEFDVFVVAGKDGRPDVSRYLLSDVLDHLRGMGHRTEVTRWGKPIPGDAAPLHVDSTIVEPKYLELQKYYPRAINFGTGDISKRKVSRLLLDKGDNWAGPVMVKSNFNNNALSEDTHNR